MSTFGSGKSVFFDSTNRHVLASVCGDVLVALANFSEHAQTIPADLVQSRLGGAQGWHDLVAQTTHAAGDVALEPYQFVWLVAQTEKAPKRRKKANA